MKNEIKLIYIAPYFFFLGTGFVLGVSVLPDLNAENSALRQEIRAAQMEVAIPIGCERYSLFIDAARDQ